MHPWGKYFYLKHQSDWLIIIKNGGHFVRNYQEFSFHNSDESLVVSPESRKLWSIIFSLTEFDYYKFSSTWNYNSMGRSQRKGSKKKGTRLKRRKFSLT